MTSAERRVLKVIAAEGPISTWMLGGVSSTGMLSRLELKGYIRRYREKIGRTIYQEITDKGRAVLGEEFW